MHWNLKNDKEFGSKKLLKLKNRRGNQIIHTFCKIGSHRNEVAPLWFVEISGLIEKYSWIMRNTLKYNEWWRIWVWKTFKIEIQEGGPNNSDILQNWFLPEIRSPLFNWYKFENPERSTPESYKMDWNLLNDLELGSEKLFKLK